LTVTIEMQPAKTGINTVPDGWEGIGLAQASALLHRNRVSLLELKRAGFPAEFVEACFLLGRCRGSLLPDRLEDLRANPVALSGKIREIRERLEQGDALEAGNDRWAVVREPLARALDFLEKGIRSDSFPKDMARRFRFREGPPDVDPDFGLE